MMVHELANQDLLSYLIHLVISEYGPIAFILYFLIISQVQIKDSVVCLAKNINGVDEEEVEREIRMIPKRWRF